MLSDEKLEKIKFEQIAIVFKNSKCSLFKQSQEPFDSFQKHEQQLSNLWALFIIFNFQSMKNQVGHYRFINHIGSGSTSQVYTCQDLTDNSVVAVKYIRKQIFQNPFYKSCLNTELSILKCLNSQFLTKYHTHFIIENQLYIVTDYYKGGDLFQLLQAKQFLSEQEIKFFAAQVVLALEQLHANNIIYRDLKPENIMLDQTGYIRLIDFGISKLAKQDVAVDDDADNVLYGTYQYMAPQIIQKIGHSKAVDWWCLGCLLYQLLFGKPPFNLTENQQLFQQILYNQPSFSLNSNARYSSVHFTKGFKNIISKLLTKNPQKRLGTKLGAKQIKKHPWFASIDWDKIKNKQIIISTRQTDKTSSLSNLDKENN